MRIRYAVATTALALFVWSATGFAAVGPFGNPRVTKGPNIEEKVYTPRPNETLVDVPEIEPNDDYATQSQLISCGDNLRPATIGVTFDVDYVKFFAVAGTVITVGTLADNAPNDVFDTVIELRSSVTNLQLAFNDDGGPGLYSLISNFVAPYTGIYYFGIAAYDTETGSYQAFVQCAPPQPPPANDNCAGAIKLQCGPIALAGSSAFANNDYTPIPTGLGGCTGFSATGRDVVYRIDAAPGDMLSVVYTMPSLDASIYLITNCADPGGSCVAGADDGVTGDPEVLQYTFTSVGTYYLILDVYGPGGSNPGGDWILDGSYECGVVSAKKTSWGTVKKIYR